MNHDLDYYRKIQGLNDTTTEKEAEIRLIKGELTRDFYNTLDCESVQINGVSSDLLITKSTDQTIKNITTKPDESVHLGDIISWCDTNWIVDTIDADSRINTHGKMRRCNVVLKWMDEGGVTRSYPGFCEDATKYGEGVSGSKMLQTGEFQIKLKIHLDEHSVKINRDRRFLLDASQYLAQMETTGSHPSAYIVTRRNVLTGTHAGHGYVELTLCETAFSELDNPALMLADYYSADDVFAITVANADGNLTIAKGATYTLSCAATKNGTALDQTSILFQSSDTSVATVSTAGVIKGVENGTCSITAKAGNVEKSISVAVYDSAPSYVIHINPVDNDFSVVYGMSKTVNISIESNNVELPYTLSSEIISGSSYASITNSSDNQIVVSATNNPDNVGKIFTLKVSEAGRGITAEADFKIEGWF